MQQTALTPVEPQQVFNDLVKNDAFNARSGLPRGGNITHHMPHAVRVAVTTRQGEKQERVIPEGTEVTFYRSPSVSPGKGQKPVVVAYMRLPGDEQLTYMTDGLVVLKSNRQGAVGGGRVVKLKCYDDSRR